MSAGTLGGTSEVRWERLLPEELERAFDDCPAVFFPYGLCEPHGPHCALGLDALKAHGLAVRAAREHGGIVAPADYWHVHEQGGYALWAERHVGERRPWLTAVPPWVHFKNVCYHLRAAEVLGFHAALLLTGHHGPNYLDLRTVAKLAQPYLRLRVAALTDFELNRPGFSTDGADGDHAGKVETSLLWALEPDLVAPERIPDPVPEGLFGLGRDALESDPAEGERMAGDIVAALGRVSQELRAEWLPDRPSRLRTFADVERFWTAEVRPRLGDFESMRSTWSERTEPDRKSRWRENWPVFGGRR